MVDIESRHHEPRVGEHRQRGPLADADFEKTPPGCLEESGKHVAEGKSVRRVIRGRVSDILGDRIDEGAHGEILVVGGPYGGRGVSIRGEFGVWAPNRTRTLEE